MGGRSDVGITSRYQGLAATNRVVIEPASTGHPYHSLTINSFQVFPLNFVRSCSKKSALGPAPTTTTSYSAGIRGPIPSSSIFLTHSCPRSPRPWIIPCSWRRERIINRNAPSTETPRRTTMVVIINVGDPLSILSLAIFWASSDGRLRWGSWLLTL